MTRKRGKRAAKRAKFTLPGNMGSPELVDLHEEKNEDDSERKWALEDKEDVDVELQIALYASTQLSSSSTTRNEDKDSSKKIPRDVKKKGIDTGPIPLKTDERASSYCVICDDAKLTKPLIKSHCQHHFCEDCIRIYIGEKFHENILSVKCPAKDCKALLQDNIFWDLYLPEEVFDQWLKTFLESKVLASPEVIECPVCFEDFYDDGRNFLIRACPKCWKIFCMNCRVPWHMNKSCDDIQ